jgi:hypothetical protein
MSLKKTCSVCSKAASYRCVCKSVYYCGKEHQKQDWKNHKGNCVQKRETVLQGSDDRSIVIGLI